MWWAQGCPGADMEQHLAGLRADGWSEQALAIERAECELLLIPGHVWPENHTTVRVFTLCQWTIIMQPLATTAVPRYIGIAAQEIESVCSLLAVPRKQRADVLWGVRQMADAARAVLDEAR